MANDSETNPVRTASGRAVEFGSLILRHKALITFTSMIGMAFGYLYFVKTTPIFQASCTLMVRNESNMSAIPFQGTDNHVVVKREQPHATLIASPLVVEKALDKVLGENAIGEPEDRRLRDLPAFARMDNPTYYILQHFSARPSLQNNIETHDIISASYTDTDPLIAKIVLEKIVESYQDFLGESQRNTSVEVLQLIDDARSKLLAHMHDIQQDYAGFRQETPLLFNGEMRVNGETRTGNIHRERMKEIELARAKVAILATERKAELESIKNALKQGGSRDAVTFMLKSLKPGNSEGGLKSPAMEVFELILEQQLLLLDLGPEHPKVKAMEKKINLLEAFHNNDGTVIEGAKTKKRSDFLTVCLDAFQHEITSIESKIVELDEMFENERDAAKAISVYEVREENYRKELDNTDILYQRVVRRLDELNLLQDYGGYKTALLSSPEIGRHVAPVFSQSLLLGTFCGALLGLGLSYFAEAGDTTFRTPEEVSEFLHLPIIGHVPVIANETAEARRDSILSPTLVAFFRPKSRQAESYRAIRTSLYFSTRGERHKVIQVSSPNPGDGKTTLSANLAISIAQSGKRVLLVDADFRRPRIHVMFGLQNGVGMSSVIGGEIELPDAIQATEVENLWALPCGPRPNNPCELLTSRRFEELLAILRDQYDFVIVDTPPLLAVTDPGAVAPRVDGILLTIRLTNRTRGEAMRATQLLAELGGNTLGVVINGLGNSGKRGYGYGGYGYGEYGGYQYQYNTKYHDGSNDENPYYSDDEMDKTESTKAR